jgi:hypothetical protein
MNTSLFRNLSLSQDSSNGTALSLMKSSVNISTTRFIQISGGYFGGAIYINNDVISPVIG